MANPLPPYFFLVSNIILGNILIFLASLKQVTSKSLFSHQNILSSHYVGLGLMLDLIWRMLLVMLICSCMNGKWTLLFGVLIRFLIFCVAEFVNFNETDWSKICSILILVLEILVVVLFTVESLVSLKKMVKLKKLAEI